nr:hypothetical protein [Tanacetum cinerariifolium]
PRCKRQITYHLVSTTYNRLDMHESSHTRVPSFSTSFLLIKVISSLTGRLLITEYASRIRPTKAPQHNGATERTFQLASLALLL